MPIVATVAIDLLDMAMRRLTIAPSQHHSPTGQEHGRTIPLGDIPERLLRMTAERSDQVTTAPQWRLRMTGLKI
jgi:hypothetical protein